ncbi:MULTISPECIES: hypothetical protein [unclassified Streptococcus]|uniref:hypothetical protein n=1 Tax=unclassified Streptococcus TaxID=2608887 RepID=UPI00359EBF46
MKTQTRKPLTEKELLNISGGVAVIDPFACGGAVASCHLIVMRKKSNGELPNGTIF